MKKYLEDLEANCVFLWILNLGKPNSLTFDLQILESIKMHEAHKRVHDPQLVKHLPGRNHKANMVHLEGCCRERCGVGSETLLFVKWNALVSKSIWTKIFL